MNLNDAVTTGRVHAESATPLRDALPISNHFPPQIRDALVAASRTFIPTGDPMARAKAIDHVVEHARIKYPELFH